MFTICEIWDLLSHYIEDTAGLFDEYMTENK